MSEILLICGSLILLLAIHDFFYTTLSGSGAGFIAEIVSIFSDKVIQVVVQLTGRNAYNYQGLFVNLMILSTWLLLIWGGLHLIYSSNPEGLTNSSGRVANNWERLYFTGYTLSTLGMGNFKPTTAFFEILTSCFSFFGFIFFTSSMTYFLSVSSSLVNKRSLSKGIYSLGNTPQRIAEKFRAVDPYFSYQKFLNLQEMVSKHSVNHNSYPVIHFYTEKDKTDSFSINITRLDEAISILLNSEKDENLLAELEPLRSSVTSFLKNMDTNFSRSLPRVGDSVNSADLPYILNGKNSEELIERRRILERLLRSEGFNWKDVVGQDM
ncbi:ion channel [Salegentibacter sp. F188]|uniref:Ion channel n=1 Tax=Autumnicola patrickiae TaxID=3075591 RepID=A0ABU3DYK6_9FLAO|nr:ion channel [Salegentibacter sp. F188]MDT0688791.1 ion channel [Salegentibacter sp. F188]